MLLSLLVLEIVRTYFYEINNNNKKDNNNLSTVELKIDKIQIVIKLNQIQIR